MARGIWTSVGGGADLDIITAGAGDILVGKTIVDKEGEPVIGTMPNKGAWGTSIGINGNVTIPAGYHNGTGKVTQSIPVFSGQTVTPSNSAQTVSCAGKYASGNVVINAIPSNFTDLTGGRVGFNETAFYSPLDGGVRSMNADADSSFYGIVENPSFLGKVGWGLFVIVSSNHWNWVVCNHSVNLTDVSRIEVNVIQTGKTKIEIYSLDKRNIVAVAELYRTGTVSVNTSALKGHHYITFAINAFNLTGYNSYATMIKKITFY